MKAVRVGIIGVGNMGTSHFESIKSGRIDGMEICAVCDTDRSRLDYVSRNAEDISVYGNFSELLSNPEIDAVIIAVPHPLHSEIAVAAFEKGKHVLVEKPVDISVSAAEMLNAAAKKSGKRFGIMFNQRTDGLFQKARQIVKSGELGEIKRSVWIITNWYRTQSYYDSGSWRATWRGEGGGVLLNQAPHNLDIWQWICGMPSAVTAHCNTGKFHNIEVEDEAVIYAEYPGGATGVFIVSTGDLPGTNRFEISGTRGKLVLESGKIKHWKLDADERSICRNSVNAFETAETRYSEFTCENGNAHEAILQNFANAVISGEELLAPGFDGINELMISNAAYLSEWNGNKKVALPFDNAEFDRLLAQKIAASSLKEGYRVQNDSGCNKRWRVNW